MRWVVEHTRRSVYIVDEEDPEDALRMVRLYPHEAEEIVVQGDPEWKVMPYELHD